MIFSFYGFHIEIRCDDVLTLDNVRRDYSFLLSPGKVSPDAVFEVFDEKPDYLQKPPLKATFYTPRNICYKKIISF
jgi:hypothetical protein